MRNDLIGKRFGKLLVLEYSHTQLGGAYFKCICDCGKYHIARSSSLNNGETNSCGCIRIGILKKNSTKHGMYKTRIYRIWQKMIARCENIEQAGYNCYGGRGIKVCDRWHSFIDFYNDTKEGYSDKLTLDRFPNKNGDYEPTNFRWATIKEQSRNKRSNVYLEYNGEKLTHIEWSEKLGYNEKLIGERLRRGWPTERILTEPPNASCRKKSFINNTNSLLCHSL